MSFSPEDIANRLFTPSAEGYHQGEVRDFLERVAREVRALQAATSAQSTGTAPVPVVADASSPETSTADMRRLHAVSDRLEALADQIQGALAATTTPARPSATTATATTVVATAPPAKVERVPVVVDSAPSAPAPQVTPAEPLPRVPAANLAAELGSITTKEPVFSDSANDLLDGVLDDIMGTISDD